MAPAWIIAALCFADASAGEVEVEAAVLVSEGSEMRGTDVVIRWSDRDWTATAATASFEDGLWTLEHGELSVDGSFRVSFVRAEVSDEGTIGLEAARFSPCPCDGLQPWAVRARDATWTPGSRIQLRGGWVEVLEIPLLPVPFASVPLTRSSGLLAPTITSGQDGLQLNQPLYLTLGPQADTTVTPEWRAARGLRGLGEFRWATPGGEGTVEAAAGPDQSVGRWRGGGQWAIRESGRRTMLAAQGLVRSDDAYLRDFGGTFASRGLSWTQQRALVGVGPVEAGLDLFQATTATAQRAELVARQPLSRGFGGVLGGAELGSAYAWRSANPWDAGPGQGLGWSRVQLERPTFVGPVRVDPSLGAVGLYNASDGAEGQVLPALSVVLPAWHRTDAGLERVEAGWLVSGVVASQTTAVRTGPRLSYRKTTDDALWVANARSWTDGTDLGLSADTQLSRGPWRLRGQADRTLQDWTLAAASGGLDTDPVAVEAGWITAPGGLLGLPGVSLHQVSSSLLLTLPGTRGTVKTGPDLRWNLDTDTWIRRAGQLGWTHPTGCTALSLVAGWDVDRAAPDVAARLVLSPVR